MQRRGGFVDGCHHFTGGRLLDHVASAGNAVHFTLPDFAMMLRLKAIEIAAIELAIKLQSIAALSSRELAAALTLAAKDPPDAINVLSPIYAAYQTEIESWRILPDDRIEFTMRRLPSAD